jgi:hypothetical protein
VCPARRYARSSTGCPRGALDVHDDTRPVARRVEHEVVKRHGLHLGSREMPGRVEPFARNGGHKGRRRLSHRVDGRRANEEPFGLLEQDQLGQKRHHERRRILSRSAHRALFPWPDAPEVGRQREQTEGERFEQLVRRRAGSPNPNVRRRRKAPPATPRTTGTTGFGRAFRQGYDV